MWIAIIAATLLSLIGYQSLLVEASVAHLKDNAEAEQLADDMAIYRFAVISSANANPITPGIVPTPPQHFPLGYVPPKGGQMWTNEMLADGTIFIYAAKAPPVGLVSAINRRASSSPMLVQPEVNANSTGNSNAAQGDPTSIAHGILSSKSADIQHVPVWLAHRG